MPKILVALDATPIADAVLSAGIAHARWMRAEIVLLRAILPPPELPVEVFAKTPETLAELAERNARSELTVALAEIPNDSVARIRVDVGAPWRVICDVAKEEDVALVVLGAHDHRLLDAVTGTNTTRVVNHIDRTVAVVRRPRPE